MCTAEQFNYKVMIFRNMSDKKRYLVIEGGDIRFLIGIGGTVARDDWYEEFAIYCSKHHSQLDSLYTISWF